MALSESVPQSPGRKLRSVPLNSRLMGIAWGAAMCVAVVLFAMAYVVVNGVSFVIRGVEGLAKSFRR
jgi:hypothetical protein